jgi:hypothetical protein
MNLFTLPQRIVMAANVAAQRVYWIPPAGVTWYLEEFTLMPSETSATNANDYAELTLKSGASTAISGVRTTDADVVTSLGGAFTQGTAETIAITGTSAQRAITQANPFYVTVDTSPGNGVAVDLTLIPTFSVKRA